MNSFAHTLVRTLAVAVLAAGGNSLLHAQSQTLLNVSYDATRELYQEYNKAFAKYWKSAHKQTVAIKQSHAGSGAQARAIRDGLEADVATLALSNDIDVLAQAGLTSPQWRERFAERSAPYTSTIVFLVRAGNPKGIKDWDDLVRPGVQIIAINPKTGGASRWTYLAAYGYALEHNKGSDSAAREFIRKLYDNVPILEAQSRAATTTFVERGIGDVLLAYENEALLAVEKLGKGRVQIVTPSVSIVTEPSIAVVDKNAAAHGTTTLATEYLKFWYTPQAQEIAARFYNRPHNAAVAKKYASQFPALRTFTLDSKFSDWATAQRIHFADGGVFDQIYTKGR